MFKNGKIFGKINVIDFGVIVLILILALGTYLKFGVLDKTKVTVEMSNLKYDIKISSVRQFSVDAVKMEDSIIDKQTGTYIGKVVDIKSTPAKKLIEMADGTLVSAEMPERFDLVLTIEVPGIENNTGYFANRNIEIKVGSEKIIRTKYIEFTGEIAVIY